MQITAHDVPITLQTIIAIIVWAVTIAIYFTTVRDDLKTIKEYIKLHQREASKRDDELAQLTIITAKLATLAEQQENRLNRLESNCDIRHNKRD